MKLLTLSSLLLLIFAVPGPKEEDPALKQGADYYRILLNGDVEQLWAKMGDPMKQAIGSLESLKAFQAQISDQLGKEERIVSESIVDTGGIKTYVRISHFQKLDLPIAANISFDSEKVIHGFTVSPVQKAFESKYSDYKTKTRLRLPFEEEWLVFWGGRTLAENYHAATRDQRFAYDILIMKNGKTHEGDSKKNENYYCFGKNVFSPGAGVVVSIANDVRDNTPGKLNPAQALGNHVILDHENGEYSFLAHFKQGSVKVETGERVESGTLLGQCGNSGNTTEAHIHYHLQNTPRFNDGDGLPIQFENYTADGKRVERGEPTKGQVVKPATAESGD